MTKKLDKEDRFVKEKIKKLEKDLRDPRKLGGPSLFPFFLILLVFMLFFNGFALNNEIPYSEFLNKLGSGEVKKVVVGNDRLVGELKPEEGSSEKIEKSKFTVFRVEPEIAEKLNEHKVEFSGTSDGDMSIWWWILGGFLIISFLSVIARTAQAKGDGGFGMGSPMTIGKSKARLYIEKETKTTFDDVAGVDEAKEELREVISFIKEPERYKELGAKLPKGILLVGSPGTGKTLLARALAGEADVPFLSISGSEFVEMFVGVGAARVRDLFKQAQKHAPCIIFIDELDALGRSRGINPITGSNDEKEQTLNQLLSELDGFDMKEGVILLAATNRPEILDKALLRAGRFDRQIAVDRPDRKGRLAILKVHTRSVKVDGGIDLEDIAAVTPGFSGADLANLVNEATLLTARDNKDRVTQSYFMKAFERIVGGLEKKSRALSIFERKVVAHHEIGHAMVSMALPGCDSVQKVSIIPRGFGALGYTLNQPNEDRFLMSKAELESRLAGLMGGRAAEKIVFDEISTGASDDFEKATSIARDMVTRFGMSGNLGMVAYEKPKSRYLDNESMSESLIGKRFSERTAHEIDCEVKMIVGQAYDRASAILKANNSALLSAAQALLEKESLSRDELLNLIPNIEIPESCKTNSGNNGKPETIKGIYGLNNGN